jgi:ABC-type glutathione transport system ATPase component
VLVTHDSEVGEACDRVIKMRDGRIRDTAPRRRRSWRPGEPPQRPERSRRAAQQTKFGDAAAPPATSGGAEEEKLKWRRRSSRGRRPEARALDGQGRGLERPSPLARAGRLVRLTSA